MFALKDAFQGAPLLMNLYSRDNAVVAIRRRQLLLGGAGAALSGLSGPARSATFGPTLDVEGGRLVLNGSGTRFKTIFRVYDLALYVRQRSVVPDELFSMGGAKRLAFVAHRDIPGGDLGRMLLKGLRDNNPRELLSKHLHSVGQLGDVFSRRPKIAEGQSFHLDAGKGIVVAVDGMQIGAALDDVGFFPLLMRIWLGPAPVDHQLKAALLGVPPRID